MSLFGGPSTPREARNDQARQEILSAVNRLVATEYGAGGFEVRDLYPGAGEIWRGKHATPVPHLQAVQALRRAVSAEERTALDNARGAGLTWAEIAEVLGLTEAARRIDQSPGLAGWRYAAMRVTPGEPDPEWAYRCYGRGPSADWRCRSCTGAVHEGHPDNGPVDAEQGHKPGCARYAALIAAFEASWDDEDGEVDQ
jgi:hypothetical protein